eukprot:TRINITY_DN1665_c0_g1_i1.p1 TRINITY_DN1665_c0_g1~~TRINITY_DN1665_c0_g1_i1.p1  ORF type:complete len:126 (+),score=14.84 TRINITY_DN1665_c0_g1_i1:180-557(+)
MADIDPARFDHDQLDQISEADHEFEQELFDTFVESYTEDLEFLRDLLPTPFPDQDTSGHADRKLHAHSIKGAASNLGAKEVSAKAHDIELQCIAHQYAAALVLLPKLEAEYEEFCKIWKRYQTTW